MKQAIPGHSLPPRRPPAKINLRPEKEKDFEAKVKKLAHLYGWHGFHISFSHGAVTGVHTLGLGDDHYDSNGFPDWIFVRGDRIIYRELKGGGRRGLTDEQKLWHAWLKAAGQDVDTWKSGDEQKVIATFRAGLGGVP